MRSLILDCRYALRTLGKRPGFTAIAVLTLALGIGANTTLFSIVNGVLLKPLPYPRAERLAVAAISVPDFRDFQAQSQSMEELAIWASNIYNLRIGNESEQTAGIIASPSFFAMLGRAFIGRTFTTADENQLVVVLSYDLWQRRFGGDPNVLGRSLALSAKAHTVIGVMAPEFQFPSAAYKLWVPFASTMSATPAQTGNRLLRIFRMVGRFRPGVTGSQAQAEAETISRRLQRQYPDTNANFTIRWTPLYERMLGDIRPALLILMGTVGLILLIACANVANLILARAIERRREIVIRIALGTSRARVLRQLLTESVTLSILGGGAGLLLAFWAIHLIPALRGVDIPRAASVRIDVPVLLFTLGISVLTGVLFGILPSFETVRADPHPTMASGVRSVGSRRSQLMRGGLMTAEVALSMVVLVGAALLVQSFAKLLRVDAGFSADRLVAINVGLGHPDNPQQRAALSRALVAAIERLPDVEAVGAGTGLPPQTAQRGTRFELLGRAPDPGMNAAYFIGVSPRYFRALGTPLIAGREFDEHDNQSAPKVAIVSRSMANRLFPGGQAVGQQVRLVNPAESPEWRTIAGVVADIRYSGLDDPDQPAIFTPFSQTPAPFFWNYLMVRTKGDPARVAASLRAAVASVDPVLEIGPVRRMDEIVAESVARPRFNAVLLSSLSMLAFILAALGIYGVVSYGVTQRTQEIAVRMALGAGSREVLRLVLSHGLRYALGGIALGVPLGLAATKVLTGLLFQIQPTDAATFLMAALFLCLVATLACWIPALRATRVDPMTALRDN